MKKAFYIIIGIGMLLFASCGRQHDAESTVKEFMSQNLTDAGKLNEVSFASIDTTRHINDSLRSVMQSNIKEMGKIYKADIQYAKARPDETLVSCRMNCKIDGRPYGGVFYLDKALTGVVAFIFYEK